MDKNTCSNDKRREVLAKLVHAHCRNCDGGEVVVVSQDDLNIDQALCELEAIDESKTPGQLGMECLRLEKQIDELKQQLQSYEDQDKTPGQLGIECVRLEKQVDELTKENERLRIKLGDMGVRVGC